MRKKLNALRVELREAGMSLDRQVGVFLETGLGTVLLDAGFLEAKISEIQGLVRALNTAKKLNIKERGY